MAGKANAAPVMVSAGEQDKVSRILLAWLNQYPDKPVKTINFEFLPADQPGMALSTVQGTYKTRSYVRGGYQAEYPFKVIYRLQPGNSNDNRLKADELLDNLGDWAAKRKDKPVLGPRFSVQRVICNTRSSLYDRYDNGDEDHQIFMTMQYSFI